MPQKINYYAVLSRAVASLDRDAYGARGAIYDREHRGLLRRLATADPPCSEEEIAQEEAAFRDAIRRIEFPDLSVRGAPTGRPEPAETRSAPTESRREPVEARRPPLEARREPVEPRREPVREGPPERPSLRRELLREPAGDPERPSPREARWRRDTADEETSREPLVPQVEPAPRASPPVEPEPSSEEPPKSRSAFRRILFYARIVLLVLGAGALAYAWTTSDIDLSWLTASSPSAASPQRAVLYDAGPGGDRKAAPLVGKATWRTRTQASGSSDKPDTVVTLDAEIPERQLAMTMTIARETETGGGMSHTFEIGFAQPNQLPFGGITGVSKIVMKGAETELGDDLIGTSVAIGPGNYLFGLLGTPDATRRNLELLRTRPWLGVLIVFANGQVQMLNAEKGASGQRAIDDALAKWGQ